VPNTRNPRRPWTPEQLDAFKASLFKFGDLGGVIRNRTTNQLIGGHKRVDAFRDGTVVRILADPQPIDRQGTVAHGYVEVDGVRFGYREVEWSLEDEMAANLAANRWAAEWDWQLVAEALQTINSDELRALTGFRDDELKNLMGADWTNPEKGTLMGDGPEADAHVVTLTAAQWVLLTDAKARLDPTGAISDAGAIEVLCRRLLSTEV